MLNRGPWGPLCWVLAFFTASYQQILWSPNSIGFPEGPLRRMWLSLPHSSHSHSNWNSNSTQLSYIIVQRSLDRPLDLWNGMIDRHPAEITVMQFTGHSLPVHQSMSVPLDFFTSSNFNSQFPPTRFPLITDIRMCHFFPVHHLGMAFLAGSKYNIRTCSYIFLYLFLCVYMYIFLWIFLDIFKYTYLYIYIKLACVCMYICIYIYIYIWLFVHIFSCVYICVCVCVC